MENTHLVGKKVVGVRYMTKKEMNAEGWDEKTEAIQFDDGSIVYASRDPEGNGPGCLFGVNKKERFYVTVEEAAE
jgi:hypothetical protein